MWHYTEGIANHSPVWAEHGIRILPGPSSLWLDATGNGCRYRCSPASTPSARSRTSGRPATSTRWFVATHKIVEKEFALSGSEQNPDLTGKDLRLLATRVQGRHRLRPCRPSSTAARTSSSRRPCPNWSPA